ncbi:MAG: hypothetical protein RIS15_270 [Chloroflexota bacterium]|jgi:hypothetical protein
MEGRQVHEKGGVSPNQVLVGGEGLEPPTPSV